MKIHIPGIGTQYVDEDPPKVVEPVRSVDANQLPSVEEAIRLAHARSGIVPVQRPKTEVLKFTRGEQKESPLVDNSKGVTNPDNISGRLEHGLLKQGESPVSADTGESPESTLETNTVTFTPDPNSTPESEAKALVDRLSEFGVDPLTQ